jgi:hypothetical protein
MSKPKLIYFDGQKNISLLNNPAAWATVSGGGEQEGSVQEYYRTVPWLYRGTDLRANAVASLPFAIVKESGDEVDSSDDYQNEVGFLPNPEGLLALIEASLTLLGKSYLFHEYNLLKTLGLRFILASSVTPKLDAEQGLVGFKRQVGNISKDLAVEDIVYFWLRDPFTEIGPPSEGKAPGQAALMAAGVLHNLAEYAGAYFKRGAVRPMIMTVPGPAPAASDRNRIKAWLRRVFLGIDNAWTTEIFQEGTDFKVIGDGIGELSSSDLTKEQREDISVALGIPISILWSTEAGGLGGGGVVDSDERKFYSQTIVPEARFIQGVLNEQVFSPMGYRWVFRPETLDIFQEDENQRSQALVNYTNAGLPLEVAGPMLGLELPEGYTWEKIAAEKERRAQEMAQQLQANPQQNPQRDQGEAVRADLERWYRKTQNKGADCEFESEHIPPALMDSIKASIEELGADAAFEFLKKKS